MPIVTQFIMDFQKMTIKSQQAIQDAQQLVTEKGQQSIETAHLLRVMLDADKNVIPYLLKKLSINTGLLEQALDKQIESFPKVSGGQIQLSRTATEAVNRSFTYLKEFGDEF